MAEKFLDTVYDRRGPDQIRALYDEWASSYDAELAENGYVTPLRLAGLLAAVAPDRSAPLLDYGCGTGVSGAALAAAGFSAIDGVDISSEMLKESENKGVYRDLQVVEADRPFAHTPGDYPIITAVGVIGVGAAPVSAFDLVMDALAPGGLFAFSFNDHALEDPVHLDKLRSYTASGRAIERASSFGDHITGRGSKSMIWVIEKT